MKKQIIITLLLGLFVHSALADGQWKYTNYRSEGFTLSSSFGLPQVYDVTPGWQIGPHWNIGLDIAYLFPFSSIDTRYYILDRRCTPYLQAKIGLAPALQVGFAFGKLELGMGIFHNSIEFANDPGYPPVLPAFTIGYTCSFGKW